MPDRSEGQRFGLCPKHEPHVLPTGRALATCRCYPLPSPAPASGESGPRSWGVGWVETPDEWHPSCEANDCTNPADWAFIGDGGDLYLCVRHGGLEPVPGWTWIAR